MQRYLAPLSSLADDWGVKAAASAAAAAAGRMFAADLELAALLVLLVAADLATGVWASVKTGRPIRSRGLRQTVVKGVEYAAFCGASVGVGNVLARLTADVPVVGGPLAAFFGTLGTLTIAYCLLTEFVSVQENLASVNPRIARAWAGLRSLAERLTGGALRLTDSGPELRAPEAEDAA